MYWRKRGWQTLFIALTVSPDDPHRRDRSDDRASSIRRLYFNGRVLVRWARSILRTSRPWPYAVLSPAFLYLSGGSSVTVARIGSSFRLRRRLLDTSPGARGLIRPIKILMMPMRTAIAPNPSKSPSAEYAPVLSRRPVTIRRQPMPIIKSPLHVNLFHFSDTARSRISVSSTSFSCGSAIRFTFPFISTILSGRMPLPR